MILVTVLKILFNIWFWFALIAVIIVIHFFWGKTPAPKKPSKLFLKHKKTVTKATDIFIICLVLMVTCVLLARPIYWIHQALSELEPVRSAELQFATLTFLVMITVVTGFSGAFIGMLSIFQSKLTRTKRVVLLSVCLLPIAFSALSFFTDPAQRPTQIINICLRASLTSWVVNFPAIFFGIHFISITQKILCKLRLVSKESFVNEEQD